MKYAQHFVWFALAGLFACGTEPGNSGAPGESDPGIWIGTETTPVSPTTGALSLQNWTSIDAHFKIGNLTIDVPAGETVDYPFTATISGEMSAPDFKNGSDGGATHATLLPGYRYFLQFGYWAGDRLIFLDNEGTKPGICIYVPKGTAIPAVLPFHNPLTNQFGYNDLLDDVWL